ncbi:MAG: hypothetical protein B7Z39_01565 [Novosphingobium sp. 12-64-8]|nr:MAG: hypothetical protein B7Z39_01565 [Novosphingobium sp. 12-64-8]
MVMRSYFTTFYLTEITVPDGQRVSDYLHPEWANLRIVQGILPEAKLRDELATGVRAIFTGPTSTTVHFSAGTSRVWGVGLLPLGWATFVGAPANTLADRIFDAAIEPAFVPFRPLIEGLFGPVPDEQAELDRIVAHFAGRLGEPLADANRIEAVHTALVDPETSNVADMAEKAGLATHTIERLCRRYFGFTPRTLLRRQRFMRSLSQYMLDPSLRWIGAMDGHYYDQAQFVRDFHLFMGMSPSEYAAMPHPVLSGVMKARQQAAGAAVQALHLPGKG